MQDDAPDQPSSPRQTNDQVASPSTDTDSDDGPTTLEEVKDQASPDIEELDDSYEEKLPTLQSATIDCGLENNVTSQLSPEHQRPLRRANRPTRFRDTAFDTHFEPKPRRKKCKKISLPQKTGKYIINREEYFRQGRGVYQQPPQKCRKATFAATQEKTIPASSITEFHTRHAAKTPVKTSTNLQERLKADTLQFSSAAAENAAINKSINAARPFTTTRPTAAAAAARGRGTTA